MRFSDLALPVWISPDDRTPDSYCFFRTSFEWTPRNGAEAVLGVSANTTFELVLNGTRLPVQQLADFPETPTYSELRIEKHLLPGKNTIAARVYYSGGTFSTSLPGLPFFAAAAESADSVLFRTDSTWKCTRDVSFSSARKVWVSPQLGYSFSCDTRKCIDWFSPDAEVSAWQNAVVRPETMNFTPRTVPQLSELPCPDVTIVQCGVLRRDDFQEEPAPACMKDWLSPRPPREMFAQFDPDQLIDGYFRKKFVLSAKNPKPFVFQPIENHPNANGCYLIADQGRETTGYPLFLADVPEGTVIDFACGEHLDDGRVRAFVGGRHFADRIVCRGGLQKFLFVHRRIAGRFVELHITGCAAGPVAIHYAGMLPLELPLGRAAAFHCDDRLLERLDAVSGDTLKLGMHEHYEDCPWREQSLYGYDSRNQMLYGYYLWGNYAFAASSLNLLGQSFDGERYLALTAPASRTGTTIPVFTFAWLCAVREHALFSGSPDVFLRWRTRIDQILDKALSDHDPECPVLYHPGTEKRYWNFCEWNGALSGQFMSAPYNLYLLEALRAVAELNRFARFPERAEFLRNKADALAAAIEPAFRTPDGMYSASVTHSESGFYEHVQALMLTNRLVPEELIPSILDAFRGKSLHGLELNALLYLMNGMLDAGPDGRALLLHRIREIFDPMILSGATSLWETRTGADDFELAGSLCHAWSAVMPCFRGRVLLGVRPLEPGFRKFEVKPWSGGLPHAEGEVPTPYGMIHVEWTRVNGTLEVSVTHPPETEPVFASWPECPSKERIP